MSGPLVEVSYFESSCKDAMAAYLNTFGFASIKLGHHGRKLIGSSFSNGSVALQFTYWPEDFPRYCVMTGICRVSEYTASVGPMIGLWYLLPPEERRTLGFQTKEELDDAFDQLRTLIFPRYIVPYFIDPQLLTQKVNQFQGEQSAKTEKENVERQRLRAETEFRKGNFGEVIKIYSQFSPVDFTATDTKRFRLAQKKMG